MTAGSPGAVEAAAYDMKRAGVGLGEVAQAIRDHGHRVTSDWDGSASVAASLAITHLSNRTWVGSDVAAAMVPVLLDYAGELRLAQDDYAMGAAAAATGTQSKAAADAAVAAAGAAGVVDHLNEAASAAAGAQISAGHADMLAPVKREERANELAADQVVELTGRLSDMTAEVLSPPQHMPLYGSGDGPDFGAEPMSVGAVLSRAASQPSSTSSLWKGRDLSDDAWEYVKGGARGYGNAAKDSWSSIKEVATQSPLTTGKEMAAGVATTYADGGVNGLFQTYINPVDDLQQGARDAAYAYVVDRDPGAAGELAAEGTIPITEIGVGVATAGTGFAASKLLQALRLRRARTAEGTEPSEGPSEAPAPTPSPDAAPTPDPTATPPASPSTSPTPLPDVPRPPVSDDVMSHALDGEFNKKNQPVGWHHRPDGIDPAGRRRPEGAAPVIDPATGAYSVGPVEMQAPDGTWKTKHVSTFFPDDWTRTEIEVAIKDAWADSSGTRLANGRWFGTSNGLQITGFYDTSTGRMRTAFPFIRLEDSP